MKTKNVYSLPLDKKSVFLAISDPRAHYSYWKHAVDFSIDFEVPIIAALDGEIWNVKDDSNEGGDDERYSDPRYQNFITIKHANNEYSQYGHLAHKSSLVKIGDSVKKGDKIAKGIGLVGFTTAPHLHMMVFVDKKNKVGWESLEINFDRKIKIIRTPGEHGKELAKPKYKKLMENEKENF